MPDDVSSDALAQADSLESLKAALEPLAFMAGWNKREPSLWPQPRTRFKPTHWRWRDAKRGLERAGGLISTDQADRRNLFMVNPIEGNYYATLRTLVSAYQMILPGERARSHRHSPNALRLVLDVGEAVYTVVDGVRIDMKPGDVVLTPGWCWHGHGNDGEQAGYWVDYLDVPLVHLLEPMFLEYWPSGFQTPEQTTRDSPYVFSWASTLAALDAAKPDPSGRRGVRVELGAPALPTTSLHMERLSGGFETRPFRTSANQIFTVVSGSGQTVVGDQTFAWERGDVFVVPSWHVFSHAAKSDAVLFCVSDETTQRKLGFLRESDA